MSHAPVFEAVRALLPANCRDRICAPSS